MFCAIGWGIVAWGIGAVSDFRESYEFNHLSAAAHLAQAKAACGNGSQCINVSEADRHLSKIPASAPEYSDALKLRATIDQQEAREQEAAKLERDESRAASWAEAQSNFQGQAQDNFICALSRDNQLTVSFDSGRFWRKDDGRCVPWLKQTRDEEAQEKRDEDAQIYSYRSTTIRVDTDMDSFWLPDEERTCQTFPDSKGRVATVLCDANAHANHNIPVKFWGGVDRDTVSDWKCRREKDVFSDEFVCRAID